MSRIEKTCELWAKTIADGGDASKSKHYSNCNVLFSGDTIYSYGRHFAMAVILAPNLVWFNGDRFSVSTANHQAELRSAIRRYAPGATVLIVPESALSAASVDIRSIRPVHGERERWDYTLQTSATPPADMNTRLYESSRTMAWVGGQRVSESRETFVSARWGDDWNRNGTYSDSAVGWVVRDGSKQLVRKVDGAYQWHTARHWLGDAVFTAERRGFRLDPTHPRGGEHTRERVHFISSFDHQETRPLYFLSQLPGPASTVTEAIELLAPESVKTARDMGKSVVRQGDMFAIEMDVTTRQLKALGATFQKRTVKVAWTDYAADQNVKCDALESVTAGMVARPEWKYVGDWAQHRADADAWYTELGRRCAAKYPELWPTEPSRVSLDNIARPRRDRWNTDRTVTGAALYGTAHTATEVATLPDGRQYARGSMYHEPAVIGERRDADHKRQPLGKKWHVIARNTVPVSGPSRNGR